MSSTRKYKLIGAQLAAYLIIMKTDGMAYLNTNITNWGLHKSAELTFQGNCLAVKVFSKIIKMKIHSLFFQNNDSFHGWLTQEVLDDRFSNF